MNTLQGHRLTYTVVRDPEGNFWTVTCSCGFEEHAGSRKEARNEGYFHKVRERAALTAEQESATASTATVYLGPNNYYRARHGLWFFLNASREAVYLDPNDPIDAVTIATLERNLASDGR